MWHWPQMSGLAKLLGLAAPAACAAVWLWWHEEHPTASSDMAELPVSLMGGVGGHVAGDPGDRTGA